MNSRPLTLVALLLGLATPALADCGGCGGQRHAHDIVDTAVEAGSFKTLAAALQAADLIDALKGAGPFTVFAPTDAAFAKLPAGTVESLLEPRNKDKLISILKFHVAAGRLDARSAVEAKVATTLNGQRVRVEYDRNAHQVRVAGATVTQPDIACTNGVVHAIDTVLLPSDKDLLATAAEAGSFSTLAAAIEAAGLTAALQGEGPFTVFAPTDAAFAKLPAGTVESLLEPGNKDKLISILKFHVVPGRVYSDQALAAGQATTLQGGQLAVSATHGKAMVNSASLLTTDIETTNGVIHVIDTVLLPGATTESSRRSCPAQGVIERAIARAEALLAQGHPAAAAELYEQTAFTLVELGGEFLPTDVRGRLQRASTAAARLECMASRSTALRAALDAASGAIAQAQHTASECPLRQGAGKTFY